jgi:hypothetical protein
MLTTTSFSNRPFSRRPWVVLGFLSLLLPACGIQFQEASLYDGLEPATVPPKPEKIILAVEPEIFSEDGTNFWTPEDDGDCTEGEVTDEVAHSGKYALKINWNRDPEKCGWAGFGIGWDDWAGKDLTDVFNYGAIEMYVRTQQGKMFGLPIVLTLEDYSGGMGFSYTGNKYFERYYLDEEWQKVVVPLNSFDIEIENLDLGNVKQLMFELQQGGGIYLDDIRIVFYEPQPTTPWYPNAPQAPNPGFPIQIFADGFINDNGWGLLQDPCQHISLTDATASEGRQSIHAVWDKSKEDCYQVAIGASWNKWFPADLSASPASTFIVLDVNWDGGNSLSELPVKVGFEDYQRAVSLAPLQDELLTSGTFQAGTWQTVRIPLTALSGNANLADIKQLLIRMEDSGEVYFDNIRLLREES